METKKIDQFRSEYYFLSNFYDCPVELDGIRYRNAEAAFQAQKTLDVTERRAFASMTPRDAKRAGRRVKLRPDWESVKDSVMETVVEAKFLQNPDLKARLLATGDAELLEGNTWHDTCWGVDLATGAGQNRLGKILMALRERLSA